MQSMVPLYGFGSGSGGTGAKLTVTAPAGCTVTVAKEGKTKTKVADSSGAAVFKGLSSGVWTITITDGEQTAQKTVTITADYTAEITFFSATIHVTYPAGSVCTATDGVTTLTAPDTSGTWECIVPNAGTWTVSVNDTVSDSVEIVAEGSETELIFRYASAEDLRSAMAATSFARLSTSVGDKFSSIDGDSRYFVRTTDEPVIFIPSRNQNYSGYGVIALDEEWTAYSNGTYGALALTAQGVTNSGKQYYMYHMVNMRTSGSLVMTLSGIGDVSVSAADCYIDYAAKSLGGNSACIEQMHGFIDSLAQLRR